MLKKLLVIAFATSLTQVSLADQEIRDIAKNLVQSLPGIYVGVDGQNKKCSIEVVEEKGNLKILAGDHYQNIYQAPDFLSESLQRSIAYNYYSRLRYDRDLAETILTGNLSDKPLWSGRGHTVTINWRDDEVSSVSFKVSYWTSPFFQTGTEGVFCFKIKKEAH